MKKSTRLAGITLAIGAASLFALSPAAEANHASKKVDCYGVNGCKGKSACKTANNACKGQNTCKGMGMLSMNKKSCKKAGGSLEAAPAPADEVALPEDTAPKD